MGKFRAFLTNAQPLHMLQQVTTIINILIVPEKRKNRKVEKRIRKKQLKSMIVNSVHDSIVIDTYPGEEAQVKECIGDVENALQTMLGVKFELYFDVPLNMDCKIGDNWMEVAEYS